MDDSTDPLAKRGARVLVADDSLVNRRVLEAMLRADGHTVIEAGDGLEAVELFERERPDMVLLDVLMPRMDGREASRRIKVLAGDRLVPVVFITALEDDADLESCVEAGADDFLTKPFDAATLRAKLRLLNRIREIHSLVQSHDRDLGALKRRLAVGIEATRERKMVRSRVLVVDDSALMRQVLSEILSQAPELEVVGTAADAYAAWEKIQTLRPDVLTLDVDMPRMDGLTFLERLMRLRPMPVVMLSSLTAKGCQTTLRALELGAIDFVAKPRLDPLNGTLALAQEIVSKVSTAARARVRSVPLGPSTARPARTPATARPLAAPGPVVAVGASTGGTRALELVLSTLPEDAPAMVVVQHMPAGFTEHFAQRLDAHCRVRVKQADDGDALQRGQVLIAPGDQHVEIVPGGVGFAVRTSSGATVSGHRPSVDVLFRSCARALGPHAVGVILTGMGDDGARGLLEMRQAGARTIAQDEASCVVFGMPKVAIELGAAEHVLSIEQVAGAVLLQARMAA